MNPLEAASEDPKWNKATVIISPDRASEPILLVEGEFDRKLLRRKWQEVHRDNSRNISIQKAKNQKGRGGKEVVLADYKIRVKTEPIFALVDMDYDFEEKRISFSSSVFHTSPFVTLATHYFPDDDAAKEIILSVISEIGGNYKDKLDAKIIESIIRTSRVLTWIKLYKGDWRPKHQNKFGNFDWKDVNQNLSHDVLFRDHICDLELSGKTAKESFEEYVKHYDKNLKECGINDHALSHTIVLFLRHWNWAPKQKKRNVNKNKWEQAQEDLENKYFLKYFKSSETDDKFILELRDKITGM